MEQTFFFYDLETSGLKAREDRIMQFAGQRCDMNLHLVGEPVNILIKMTDDALPSPSAISVTKITPQQTLAEGISEAEFVRFVTENIFTPGTIAVGFNTVRFDDEFMRALLWRNFYDPYEWEWKDGRSRWDILDLVRMTRAVRPEGIEWPFKEDGKPTNRLELITKLNGVAHEHAHDALSDVYATIAVAQLIREKHPDLFDFMLKLRDKKEIKKYVNLDNKRPFVYVSGRYSGEFNKATVVFPLTAGRNGNILVYDLRYNLEDLMGEKVDENSDKRSFFPVVKELCYNKCPAIAPLGVLEKNDGWKKIGLSQDVVKRNMEVLLQHPEFAEQMRTQCEVELEYPLADEPEGALYDGFLNDMDRKRASEVRDKNMEELADFHPEFDDVRLPELLLHYKGRNFPQSLSEDENIKWEEYRRVRLQKQAPRFLEELAEIYKKDEFIAEELKLYYESLCSFE